MERNISNLIYDIQKLNRDIIRDDILNNETIKIYQYRSIMLRKMIDRIVNNQKNYPSYIALNINEQKQIEYGYNLLNQIDLSINKISVKPINQYKKIPFSLRSFLITITIIICCFLYYKIFISKGGSI